MTQPAPGAPITASPPLKGPRKRTAVIVILVSFGIQAVAMGGLLLGLRDRMFVTTYAVPGTVTAHLHDGTWNLYGLSERGSGANDTGVDPAVVTVEGPKGEVSVHRPDSFFFPRGSDAYRSVVEFDAPVTGDYTIRVDATHGGRVMIAPSFTDLAVSLLPWIIVTGAAGVAQLVGWVLLIVGVTRRQRAKKAAWLASGAGHSPALAAGPTLPPPGWHPDPYGTYRLRWWDGHTWTDQVSQ